MSKERIRRHEGVRHKMYLDSEGIPTIGIGRNLRDVGLTDAEVDFLFATDYQRAVDRAKTFSVYAGLNDVRRGVLVEMVFQMGRAGVAKFKNFLAAAERADFYAASSEMLNSKWAKQTPERAKELSEIFKHG